MIFIRAALGRCLSAGPQPRTWKLCLAAVTPVQIVRMVLFGTTRFRSTIRSRNVAAAVKMRSPKNSAKGQWNRAIRASVFASILFGAGVSATANTSTIVSPDHHQTFAYGEMLSHQLYLAGGGIE